jgi:hypothetical protein
MPPASREEFRVSLGVETGSLWMDLRREEFYWVLTLLLRADGVVPTDSRFFVRDELLELIPTLLLLFFLS